MCVNVWESLGCEERCLCAGWAAAVGPRGEAPCTGLQPIPARLWQHPLSPSDPMEEPHPVCPFDCTPESTSSQSRPGENSETAVSPVSRFSSRSTQHR